MGRYNCHQHNLTRYDSIGNSTVATYNTSDFRKGLKVQIDGEPYLMVEMNFVKPGKGNAFYKCRLKNLIRGNVLDRTYKGGDSLEAADVEEINTQRHRHIPGPRTSCRKPLEASGNARGVGEPHPRPPR